MRILDLMLKEKHISLKLDKNLMIKGISSYIHESDYINQIMNQPIIKVIENLLFSENFFNKRLLEELVVDLQTALKTKNGLLDELIITNDLEDGHSFYRFDMSIDVLFSTEHFILLQLSNFIQGDNQAAVYDMIFETYNSEFSIINKLQTIGTFIIDYSKNRNMIYANDTFATLLGTTPDITRYYLIDGGTTEINNRTIIKNPNFLLNIDVVLSSDLDIFANDFQIGSKWIKMETKILKKEQNDDVRILAGILYDVSDYHMHKSVEYFKSIYELALTSGNIGFFYYNLHNHGNDLFEANDIYAKMIGILPTKEGLYRTDDFVEAVVPLEEEIAGDETINKKLSLLLSGDIDGTTDDLIKIHNKLTNQYTYILSSSKIEERFEDGTPSRFGGIIFDVTDRIKQEKNQIAFAYKDELTSLHNNRKLFKDMTKNINGIGLFFDLDNFKKVNDTYGHLEGNNLLQIFAKALLKISGKYKDANVYRLYGDEFFAFLPNQPLSVASEFEKKLDKEIAKAMKTYDKDILLAASMGFAEFKTGDDVDNFIKQADYEMYKVKILKQAKKE